jgi:hypothetical protein
MSKMLAGLVKTSDDPHNQYKNIDDLENHY